MNICSQKLASIQPRTSPPIFGKQLAKKSGGILAAALAEAELCVLAATVPLAQRHLEALLARGRFEKNVGMAV